MTTNSIDRIPLAHSVHYAVRGLPEVPNQYGAGALVPSEITLTYRAAPDSQLGRVHAYVAGRIWVDGAELPLLPGGLYGQHYFDGLDGWPEWLAAEARLHDPERAVSSAVVAPPTGQTAELASLAVTAGRALQDEKRHYEIACQENARLRAKVYEWQGSYLEEVKVRQEREAEITRLHADRAAVLHWAADRYERSDRIVTQMFGHQVAAELRRLADETPDTTPQAAEDPARIDRLRPEFAEHASVEAIDAQLRRARRQMGLWEQRVRKLTGLRQKREGQPAAGAWQDGAES